MEQKVEWRLEGFHVYEFVNLSCLWQGQVFRYAITESIQVPESVQVLLQRICKECVGPRISHLCRSWVTDTVLPCICTPFIKL